MATRASALDKSQLLHPELPKVPVLKVPSNWPAQRKGIMSESERVVPYATTLLGGGACCRFGAGGGLRLAGWAAAVGG